MKITSNTVEEKRNAEYYALMNVSGHVVTRHQLNQISKTTSNQINFISGKPSGQKHKPIELTEDQKRHNKAEKERIEREKRLEKRKQKIEQVRLKTINLEFNKGRV